MTAMRVMRVMAATPVFSSSWNVNNTDSGEECGRGENPGMMRGRLPQVVWGDFVW
jgi:hypothetical protein